MTLPIKDKLLRILERAKKDLEIWLYYCGCSNIEEFENLSEQRICEIVESSFHKYDDVQRQIKYIQKIENKLINL